MAICTAKERGVIPEDFDWFDENYINPLHDSTLMKNNDYGPLPLYIENLTLTCSLFIITRYMLFYNKKINNQFYDTFQC